MTSIILAMASFIGLSPCAFIILTIQKIAVMHPYMPMPRQQKTKLAI